MFKKKRILLLCLCASMCMLVGCAGGKSLTEEEQDMIAEYSAGVLLRNYDKYNQRLVKTEPITPAVTEQPAATPTAEPTVPDSGTSQPGAEEEEQLNEVSLDDLYHVAGMKVSYDSYVACNKYPKDSPMQLTAKKGQFLLVVRFVVKNKSSKPLAVDLMERKIAYPLDMGGKVYQPAIAMQENGGMNYLKTKLKAGASEKAILVYEIPDESKDPESMVLTVKDGGNAATIRLK